MNLGLRQKGMVLEIMGHLKIKFTNNVSLTMRCDKDKSNMKNYNIFIRNQNIHLEINEQRSFAKLNNSEKINGIYSNLSDIIPEVITNLIDYGSCEWTNLDESIFSHQAYTITCDALEKIKLVNLIFYTIT